MEKSSKILKKNKKIESMNNKIKILIYLVLVFVFILPWKTQADGFNYSMDSNKVELESAGAKFTFYLKEYWEWLKVGDSKLFFIVSSPEYGEGASGHLTVLLDKKVDLIVDEPDTKIVLITSSGLFSHAAQKEISDLKLKIFLGIKKDLPCLFIYTEVINITDKPIKKVGGFWATTPIEGYSLDGNEIRPAVTGKWTTLGKGKLLYIHNGESKTGLCIISEFLYGSTPKGEITFSIPSKELEEYGTYGHEMIVFPASSLNQAKEIYEKIKGIKASDIIKKKNKK
jgi:hypothetical protein